MTKQALVSPRLCQRFLNRKLQNLYLIDYNLYEHMQCKNLPGFGLSTFMSEFLCIFISIEERIFKLYNDSNKERK
jgi:hypothetical protein